MKKIAVTMEQIRFKQEEVKKLLNDNLTKLRGLINPNMSQTQIAVKMNEIIAPMIRDINQKVLELASLKTQTTQSATPTTPSAADDAKDSHLGPRGKKQNKKLPDFWRRNFDYGESPYMHMDKIKTITERPKLSKRRK